MLIPDLGQFPGPTIEAGKKKILPPYTSLWRAAAWDQNLEPSFA